MHLTRYIGRPTSVLEPAIQHSATNGQRKKNSPCQRPVQTSKTSCWTRWPRWPNESNNKIAINNKIKKLQTIRILGPTFAQITIRLSVVRVRESNNVLQAIQTNQSLFIKLGNKRQFAHCCDSDPKLVKSKITSEFCFKIGSVLSLAVARCHAPSDCSQCCLAMLEKTAARNLQNIAQLRCNRSRRR